MKQAFFLTDLDGTLLRSDASLSQYTIEVLSHALEQGLVISYATARSYTSANSVVSAIPWQHPVVLYNGAVIYNPVTNEVIDGNWLNNKVTDEIIEYGRKNKGLVPLLFALDHDDQERVLHEKLHRTGDVQFFASRPNDPRFEEVRRLVCPETHRTLMITYIGRLEELEPLKSEIEQRYGDEVCIHLMQDQYIEDHYFLEFSHKKANKNEGLNMWAKLMNCHPREVTVFGDNLNDVGMFEAAGIKIAVSNAKSKLVELANDVIASNDDDGVAQYIEKIRLKEDL